ncbi:MAG: CRISPR-associated protein Csx3 [Alphaproteobacteria bacterium]|uniref:CRISPR-associated protein Csx3 n=1 Tax=Candidatus Nitrobium versatile TaxID=2884831 RepID=A0A953LWM0_9BACT|nr:CRISPR-associated protein Csx3 [Candidatus Nitrobium versatile]
MTEPITVDLSILYENTDTAKLSALDSYVRKAQEIAGEGHDVVLTGAGPVWLYLKIAHALHGKARKLIYRSPVTGDVVIFDHTPD